MHLISVVLTTYNRANIVGQTIQSILNQSYQNFELLIVDDGSSDNTEEVINLFIDNRIKYIKSDNWGGPAKPRNIGIKNAIGEYIAFCDDDDIWINNKLELQIEIINKTNCDLVSSNMFYFENDITNTKGVSLNRKVRNLKDFINENQINTSTVIVRNSKDVIFNEDKNLISIEDYALWLDLYLKGMHFEFIKVPLIYYRQWQHNITKTNSEKNHLRLIYLFTLILINNTNLSIKRIIATKIGLNYLKFIFKFKKKR